MSDSAHASTVPEVYDEKKNLSPIPTHIHKHTSEAKHWNEPNLDVAWRTDVADGEAALATYKEKKKNRTNTNRTAVLAAAGQLLTHRGKVEVLGHTKKQRETGDNRGQGG